MAKEFKKFPEQYKTNLEALKKQIIRHTARHRILKNTVLVIGNCIIKRFIRSNRRIKNFYYLHSTHIFDRFRIHFFEGFCVLFHKSHIAVHSKHTRNRDNRKNNQKYAKTPIYKKHHRKHHYRRYNSNCKKIRQSQSSILPTLSTVDTIYWYC